jgi:hypothetical protein
VASGSGPGTFLSEILKKNPVAGESGADAAAISRSAYATAALAPPVRCDRYVSIRTPEEEGVGAAGTVAETPQNDVASQEGATPKPGAVRGTHVGGPRNAGVQGGTESSNLLSSSGEPATLGPSVISAIQAKTARLHRVREDFDAASGGLIRCFLPSRRPRGFAMEGDGFQLPVPRTISLFQDESCGAEVSG